MTLTEIRSALAELELTPSKGMGQNFLYDQNMTRWIVDQLGFIPGERLLEIGPGLGALTGGLLERGAHVIALEKDRRLSDWLLKKHGDQSLDIQCVDAMKFDPRSLLPGGPLKFIANLPYYVTSPVLFRFCGEASPVEQAIIMVQRELGLRMAAQPSTPDYGGLTLLLGRRWKIEYLRTLPPTLFFPAPKVDSAVMRMTLRTPGELPPCDGALFERLVKLGFSQRRKQLHKLLRQSVVDIGDILNQLGLDARVRAEELNLSIWLELTRLASGTGNDSAQDVDKEIFDVVDKNDQVIGQSSRHQVHVNKFNHRAVHLLVWNKAGELLLQKRSPWKDKFPNLWDSSASGHVDAGESYSETSERELREELGVSAPLTEIGTLEASEETGQEFIHIYETLHEGPFRLAPAEIDKVLFFPLPLIKEWLLRRPEDFAPGFRAVFRLWQEKAAQIRVHEIN